MFAELGNFALRFTASATVTFALALANLDSTHGMLGSNFTLSQPDSWIDLKGETKYRWKPFNHARVFQSNQELSLVVDTDSENKLQ